MQNYFSYDCAPSSLPACVLRDLIWPRAHQARMRASLDLIAKGGPSFFEDLPDLDMYATDELIHSCDTHQQLRGWSQRVTEFHQDLRRVTSARRASFCLDLSKSAAHMSTQVKEAEEDLATIEDVVLVSQEGESFVITRDMAAMSRLLLMTLEDEDKFSETETSCTIPLPNVLTRELTRVVAFMREHLARPLPAIHKPLRSARMRDLVSEWHANCVDLEQEELFALTLAANYLDMPALLDLTTAKVASMIKGKTSAEIRNTFHVVNDFTPEEEATALEDYACYDDLPKSLATDGEENQHM